MRTKWLAPVLAALMTMLLLNSCSGSGDNESTAGGLLKIDNSAWQYNADDDVYYQLGIPYCSAPADESLEQLAIFVPGAFMDGTENEDGSYTCELNEYGWAGGHTVKDAPIVMPVNTPGYSAQEPVTEYTSVSYYTNSGFVYVHAGCRGRDAGAPAGVTDLKAAVRYLRYCEEEDGDIPGDTSQIFAFGMSGGGAQTAVLGSSGDSSLYEPYLEAIGAVGRTSDAIQGAMCWCPITNLDSADEAYEWMMGCTRSGLSEKDQALSDRLAEAYADYVNGAGFLDSKDNELTLEKSEEGIYQAGSYYDYMKKVIEGSLNHFLEDTEFPYDGSAASSHGGMGGGMNGGGMPGGGEFSDGGGMPDAGNMPDGAPDGNPPEDGPSSDKDGKAKKPDDADAADMNDAEQKDDITRNQTSSGLSLNDTYETAKDYVDALNADGEWVKYDEEKNTVKITSVEDFVKAFKPASKGLGAFDQIDKGQGENTLFGYGDGEGAHFDEIMSPILNELGYKETVDYDTDLDKEDSVGNTVDVRLNMYTPLYYLLESRDGFGKSTVAKYWRIRTGINQSDCALATEVNLALALKRYPDIKDVDFETIWGQGHTMAERTGDSDTNFIEWVNECLE